MGSEPDAAGAPKTSETEPPAANRPVEGSEGDPPPRLPDPADAAGRNANDPSVKEQGLVHEAVQAPPRKPDGEVDTGRRRDKQPRRSSMKAPTF